MAKSSQIRLLREIMVSQINHWCLFPVVMTVLDAAAQYTGLSADCPDFLMWTLCGLFPLSFFAARRLTRFMPFVLLHVCIGALFFLIPVQYGFLGRVFCGICAGGYLIYAFSARLSQNRQDNAFYYNPVSPIVAAACAGAALIIRHRIGEFPNWDGIYIIVLIVVLACYTLVSYIDSYLNFLNVNKSSAGYLPAEEMFCSGMGLVLVYTFSGALILLLSLTSSAWLMPAVNALKYMLIAVLRFLISLLPAESSTSEPYGELPERSPDLAEQLMPGDVKPSLFWQALEYVVVIAFFCGCCFVLLKAVIWVVRFIRSRFAEGIKKGNGLLLSEESAIDVREKCGFSKKEAVREKPGLFSLLSPRERIRRLYRKCAVSAGADVKNMEELNFLTARECADKLSLPDMAEVYERARYTEKEVTAEDVRRMKEACR